jgi:hypothetical protein
MGTYEAWTEVVGGMLAAAEIHGFLGNRPAFAARADTESGEWKQFVSAWWGARRDAAADTGSLYAMAEAFLPEVLGDGSERSQRTRLGKALGKRVGWMFTITRFDELEVVVRLQEADVIDDEGRRRNGWALALVPGPNNDGGSGTLGDDVGERKVPNTLGTSQGGPNVPNVPDRELRL